MSLRPKPFHDGVSSSVGLISPDKPVVMSRLHAICEDYGLKNVACLLGVNPQSIWEWNSGQREISRSRAWRIIELSWLTRSKVEALLHQRIKAALTGKY